MTPYHLELIRQTFDGLFRPSSPDSAGKDLLDIGGEEDEPERESPRPYLHRTSGSVLNSFLSAPAPTPTAPKAPTALTAVRRRPPLAPSSTRTRELEPLGQGGPGGRQAQEGSRGPEEGKKAAPVAAKSKKEAAKEAKAAAPAPPPARRKPGPPHEAKEAAEAKGSDDAPRRTPGRGTGTSTRPQWRSPPRRRTRAAVPRTQGEGRAQAGPADRPGRLLPGGRSPSTAGGSSISLSEKCHGKRAHVLLSSIDPCPSLARPLAYERLGAIVEWFEKLGAAVLFSIIVQTSALDEARYQVVDGSHRFQVARIIVDPRRVSELPPEITAEQRTELRQRVEKLNKLHPQIRQHLKEDYIDMAVYNTLDPGGHARAATSGQPAYSRRAVWKQHLRRPAEPQACIPPSLPPKRYIREDPDFATHLEPALKELHFPKGEDAPAKLVKILECFSWRCCVPSPSSRLSDSRQPRTCGASLRDAEMNRWLARAMLEGSFSGSEATSTAAADLKKPIRQAEQTFMLLEAHDAAEVAAGDHPHLAFMNCLNVRPFPFRKGKVRLPAFSEELGELGCPFERLNETDVGNMPQEITFMDGRRLSEFELDYLMPEHCPYARLWEEMGHHDIPVPASAC
ncbi:hypothetical protein PAPYR_11069 [Paratrimastix pyriformis]|uniref:ParB/Sulfiredoxin domain-containing protein n=1 Tax=Paratrimastix pyriformis TaxID=342808 RepID=A0ABQ8UBU4_9EUKA|nr:hypothetical protein PAPYR_11069 [Paratrimastix pyriformis]